MKPDIEKDENVERRTHVVQMRVKENGDTKTPVMDGYAANFNSLSENLGGFREILMPGCFKKALGVSDIRGLFNHNPDKILGRTAAGTLRVFEDEKGLRFEIDPDMEISYVKDLQISMRRGDVNQCSFGFRVAADGDHWKEDSDGLWIRTIHQVEQLYDVSPVTYPAYTSTSCAVRSLNQKKQEAEQLRTEQQQAEEQRKADEATAALEEEQRVAAELAEEEEETERVAEEKRKAQIETDNAKARLKLLELEMN